MMNYKYNLNDVKKNNEKYILEGNIEIGEQFKQWLWEWKGEERRGKEREICIQELLCVWDVCVCKVGEGLSRRKYMNDV